MFHATTHRVAERTLHERVIPTHRLGPRLFTVLVGAELLVLIGVMAYALFVLLPPPTPLAAPTHLAPVEEAIRARVGGAVNDPLVAVAPGQSARASNLRGFSLGGETYYYYVEGRANFDPLSRGAVQRGEVEILFRDTSGPETVVVYRVQ